nr:hypothetical protein [Tanacetum cinerariifolium]
MTSFNQRPLRGEFCWFCASRAETSFANDPNPNSFDDSQNLSDYPSQPQYETYPCELCGNDSHYGYDCPPRFPLVYEQEPYLYESALSSKLLSINLKSQHLDKEKQEVKNIVEQAPERRTRLTKCLKNFKVIHNEILIPSNKTPQISSVITNTPDLPTKEPEYSLRRSNGNFKIYSSLLFDDEEIISTKIEEVDFNLEEEIHLVKNLSYDNSSLRPPKELNAKIADMILESLYPSPIPVEDSDSQIEEIDLFLATDDLMPPGIEYNDYDSERDIHFLEELLSDDHFPPPKNESSNFNHHDDPIAPNLEASRARGFFHRPLEFQSLAYGNPIS